MLATMKNAWRLADLRKKLLFTLFIIVIFRIGAAIPVPFVNPEGLSKLIQPMTESGSLVGYLNILSGQGFEKATLFAMSISPYINASIIMQLLTVAITPLANLAKEGEEGRKKIANYTRIATIALGIIQGTAYYTFLANGSDPQTKEPLNLLMYSKEGFTGIFQAVVIILCFTAGTALMMWLGEQINVKGVGNGISILLFAGIVSSLPVTFGILWSNFIQGGIKYFTTPLVLLTFVAVIWVIVLMNDAERRIPVQYAKRVVGRKMYGGNSSHLPIKVGMSGVLPIIFAGSILSIPSTIVLFTGEPAAGTFWAGVVNQFSTRGATYSVLYFILIIVFAYFYVSIQYNPLEMSNNLRKQAGTIPGIRPGKPTTDFIAKVLSKITLIGALFLALIALSPILMGAATGINLALGGTSIIILVGVALETVRTVESEMMMRHYKGFLD